MSSKLVDLNVLWTILILIAGTIGNSVVIYGFIKVKSLRTINNVFLFQLAIVDLTKAVIILPVKAYTQLKGVSNLGAFCQVSGFVSTITFVLSALLLAAISVVRYFKIVNTRNYDKYFTKRRTTLYSIAMLTATCCLASLPIIGVGQYVYSSYHGICFTKWAKENVVFRSLFYVYSIGVCYPVLIFCYSKIFIKLRRHHNSFRANMRLSSEDLLTDQSEIGARSRNKLGKERSTVINSTELVTWSNENADASNTEKTEGTSVDSIRKQNLPSTDGGKITPNKNTRQRKNQTNEKRAFRNEIRVTKIMFTVVIAYSCCWLPALAVNVLQLSGAVSLSDTLLYLVVTLLEMKIVINPLIYGLWNPQFRKGLKALFSNNSSLERTSNTQEKNESK